MQRRRFWQPVRLTLKVRISKDVGPLIVLYEYQPSREVKHAAKFQDGFSGYLHITSVSRSADSIQRCGSPFGLADLTLTLWLHFCDSYGFRFSEACTLTQTEHKQGGPGRLSRQYDRCGADHPQGDPVAFAQRHQDCAGEVGCSQLRSSDRGFIDLIVDYDLSSARHRCGGVEVVGNLEISAFFHNKLAVGFIEIKICGPMPDIRQRHRDT